MFGVSAWLALSLLTLGRTSSAGNRQVSPAEDTFGGKPGPWPWTAATGFSSRVRRQANSSRIEDCDAFNYNHAFREALEVAEIGPMAQRLVEIQIRHNLKVGAIKIISFYHDDCPGMIANNDCMFNLLCSKYNSIDFFIF